MGTGSGSGSAENGWVRARGLAINTILLIGGALLLKRLTKSTTRWDHARLVAQSLCGEKNSREQASRDPENYFNLRMMTCPATEMVDGSKVLYFEQAFWRTPQKPFRQRFYTVKPCQKEMRCDVELSTHAIRDMEEYKNYCDRSKDQRPLPEEVIGDIAEHLTTIHLSQCERSKRCLYEGATPPGGFPNFWNGATYCTSELSILKNNEIHTWDRGYDDDGNQVWGVKVGPYEFKPAPVSSFNLSSPFNLSLPLSTDKRIEGSVPQLRCSIQIMMPWNQSGQELRPRKKSELCNTSANKARPTCMSWSLPWVIGPTLYNVSKMLHEGLLSLTSANPPLTCESFTSNALP